MVTEPNIRDNRISFRIDSPGILPGHSVVSQGGDEGVSALLKVLNQSWDLPGNAENEVGGGTNATQSDFAANFASDPRPNLAIAAELNSLEMFLSAETDALALIKLYLGETLGELNIEYLFFAIQFQVVETSLKEQGYKCDGMLTAPIRSALSRLKSSEALQLMDAIEAVILARQVRKCHEAEDKVGVWKKMLLFGGAHARMEMRLHEEAADSAYRADAGGVKARKYRWQGKKAEWEKWQRIVDERRGWTNPQSVMLNMSHDAACQMAADECNVSKSAVKRRVANRTAKK